MNLKALKMWKRKQLAKEKQKKNDDLLQWQKETFAKKATEYTEYAPYPGSIPHKCYSKVPRCNNDCHDCLQRSENRNEYNQRTEK